MKEIEKMNKPICIAIEGVDCAGKGTAAKRVVKKLKALHPDKNIQLVSFPQYELASGVLIKKFLNGDYKDLIIKPKNQAAARQRKVDIAMATAQIPMAILSAFVGTPGGIIAKSIAM